MDSRETRREQTLIFTTDEAGISIPLDIITSETIGCAPCLCGEPLRRARHSSTKRRVDRLARAISTNLGYEI